MVDLSENSMRQGQGLRSGACNQHLMRLLEVQCSFLALCLSYKSKQNTESRTLDAYSITANRENSTHVL